MALQFISSDNIRFYSGITNMDAGIKDKRLGMKSFGEEMNDQTEGMAALDEVMSDCKGGMMTLDEEMTDLTEGVVASVTAFILSSAAECFASSAGSLIKGFEGL